MKKLVKTLLSLALALVVVLSLGVGAFADGAGEDDVETIDIGFDLSSAIGLALKMRNVDYDDIRLNGISYRPDAADGVMLIQLGDLAAAKLLTDYAAEAQEAGIDVAKLYIRGGRVHVNSDGMSSDEAAALSATVEAFMASYKVAVSVGDIFSLANGAALKLKLRVVNFWYSSAEGKDEKEETKLNFVAFNLKKYSYTTNGALDETPNWKESGAKDYFNKNSNGYPDKVNKDKCTRTTVFFQYYSADKTSSGEKPMQSHSGWVGIVKAEGDTNDYYVKVIFGENDEEFNKNLRYLDKSTNAGQIAGGKFAYSISRDNKDDKGGRELAKRVEIFTDEDAKNKVFNIEITDGTPELDEVLNDSNYSAVPNNGTDAEQVENNSKLAYVPKDVKHVEVTKSDETSAEVTVRGTIRCWDHDTDGADGACSKCGYKAEDTNLSTTALTPPEREGQQPVVTMTYTPEQEGEEQKQPTNPEQEGEEQPTPTPPETPTTPETPAEPAA